MFKGTVFELVDQAVDFVLARLSFAVGTRAATTQAPAAYEIPPEVIREAIVNAVAHRDYTSNGSVQVMVFADRVEVWNPGSLPPSLSLAQLRQPHGSIPANPLLAEPLYLTQYIERLGTGTGDMIRRCREAGLPEPVFLLEDGFRISLGRPLPQPSSSVTTEEAEEETKEESRRQEISGAAPGKASISREQILAVLRSHPEVTITELARQLNLNIRLNTQLAQKPKICLDYIVLHELAHLRVPGHGEAFQVLLNAHQPDWQERRALLNSLPLLAA